MGQGWTNPLAATRGDKKAMRLFVKNYLTTCLFCGCVIFIVQSPANIEQCRTAYYTS